MRGATFTTFWIQFLKAHRSIYGYNDADSDDDSFGDEIANNDDDDNEHDEYMDQKIVDDVPILQSEELQVFVRSDVDNEFAASIEQDADLETPAVSLSSSSYADSLPAPSQEVILNVSAAIPVDRTTTFDDVEGVAENGTVSPPEKDSISLVPSDSSQPLDLSLSNDLQFLSQQQSQALVMSAVDDSLSSRGTS